LIKSILATPLSKAAHARHVKPPNTSEYQKTGRGIKKVSEHHGFFVDQGKPGQKFTIMKFAYANTKKKKKY